MKTKGFTLLELLTSLSIASVLIGYGVPGYSNLTQRLDVSSLMREIRGMIAFTRQTSITTGKKATFCGLSESNKCSQRWKHIAVSFIDNNDNGTLDTEEKILRQLTLNRNLAGHIELRAFGARKIQFRSDGSTLNNNSIWFCPNNKPKLLRRMVTNKLGRTYSYYDTDGDGVIENPNGEEQSCE